MRRSVLSLSSAILFSAASLAQAEFDFRNVVEFTNLVMTCLLYTSPSPRDS